MADPSPAQIASEPASQWEQARAAWWQVYAGIAQAIVVVAIYAAYRIGNAQTKAANDAAAAERRRVTRIFAIVLSAQLHGVAHECNQKIEVAEALHNNVGPQGTHYRAANTDRLALDSSRAIPDPYACGNAFDGDMSRQVAEVTVSIQGYQRTILNIATKMTVTLFRLTKCEPSRLTF